MRFELLVGVALLAMFALGFALDPAYMVVGVLMFLLGFCAHYVFALAWVRWKAQAASPYRGTFRVRAPRRPQAVRKERRA